MSLGKITSIMVLIVGLLMVVEYSVAIPILQTAASTLRAWGVIVSTFAVGVGTVNLALVHLRRVNRRETGSFSSMALLAIMLFTSFAGIVLGRNSAVFNFVYDSVLQPLNNAVFSLVAFFVASAAYRSFRARNTDASILLAVSLIVLLGQMPMSKALLPPIAKVSSWFVSIPNVAGQRGVIIGSGVAFISLSLRIILGLERRLIGLSSD